jgi:hypothetical protein
VIPVSIVNIEIGIVGKVVRQDQYRQKQKSDRHLQRSMQSMRHRVPLSSEHLEPLLLLSASATTPNPVSRSKKIFFVLYSLRENFAALITQKLYPKTRRSHPATGWLLL